MPEQTTHDWTTLSVGLVLTAKREILAEDIAAFGELVGDQGQHHLPGAERTMAHGLLTASLATRIGGELDFIARRMGWEFLRPVWEGDTITAEVTVRSLREARSGTGVEFDIVILNQDGEAVLRGECSGVIRHDPEPGSAPGSAPTAATGTATGAAPDPVGH
ncbi:enoyl-CoA hydratase [Streptacidiphilus sp. P02-A3a]|uniref:enoyl-CoA hydratase n=1 Tax=Streptacidiphilus sp. P02-A3a TaxID=2704468 RepID=UPI0015FA5124|nr:enoyl-CoA hydratase [Streptacidiphilus sp. P02-A3a]